MTIAESPATLDARDLVKPLTLRQTLLTSQGYFSTAPWQYTVYSTLHDLEGQRENKSAMHDLTVAQQTIMFARTVVADLHSLNIPSPTICPISGGGVGMVWSLGAKQLEVAFSADQSGSFILSKGEQIVDDGDISVEHTSGLVRALRSVMSI
jgi:hypothetical protein